MNSKTQAPVNATTKPSLNADKSGLLQRQCACGNSAGLTGECATCQTEKLTLQRKQTAAQDKVSEVPPIAHEALSLPHVPFIQAKLTVGASDDPLEREADRVADQVMAAPAHPAVSDAPPRIQRFTGQPTGQADMAVPASVDRVLSSPGRPLEPGLQQDMGQRFGHDFSQVRVHTDAAAERSARDVNANAYTVRHNIVFGAGQFAPETHRGKRLIAHELTHVLQQNSDQVVQHSATSLSSPLLKASSEIFMQQQRRDAGEGVRRRQATTRVRWSDDNVKFLHRLINTVSNTKEFQPVPKAALWQPFHELIVTFHRNYSRRHPLNLNEGDWITVHVSAFYDPNGFSRITNAEVYSDEDQAVVGVPSNPSPQTPIAQDNPVPAPSITSPPAPPEACRPKKPQGTAKDCKPNPYGPHLPAVGGTHTESHPPDPCRLTQAEVAASPKWCVDAQQAHGGEICYREIPSTNDAPGDQYCYSENNCCHNSADAVSVVKSTSAGSNSCCETNHFAYPGHVWKDVGPELIDDPGRVIKDILGF